MTSLLDFLLRNWPLKLAAVAFATVLYGGVVLSQNTRTWPGLVSIDVLNPPQDAAVLDALGYMTNIQFRAPLDVANRLTNGSFRASIDLSGIEPPADGSPVKVPVALSALDASVEIVDYQPKVVNVTLDPVVNEARPVTVDRGTVPESVTIGPPQVDPQTVSLVGARSRVSSVRSVVARVSIDASGLNVDQEVDLQALDSNGAQVAGVQVQPARAHIRIDVSRSQSTVQLPVRVQLDGAPAAGYALTSLSVEPISVTVSGETPVVERLGGIATLAVDLTGRTTDFASEVGLAVPVDVTVDGPTTVRVLVGIGAAEVSRTLELGVELANARADRLYELSRPSVLVTLSGPATILDVLAPSDMHATVAVGGLNPGTHALDVTIAPIDGVTIETITPAEVSVIISEAPHVTPEPSPTPAPTPVPSESPVPPSAAP